MRKTAQVSLFGGSRDGTVWRTDSGGQFDEMSALFLSGVDEPRAVGSQVGCMSEAVIRHLHKTMQKNPDGSMPKDYFKPVESEVYELVERVLVDGELHLRYEYRGKR